MSAVPARAFHNPFCEYDPNEFGYLLRKLREEGYVSRRDIARNRALRPDEPLPDLLTKDHA